MINGQNAFDLPVQIDLRTYENVQKNSISQRDDYTTGCLLDYLYWLHNWVLTRFILIAFTTVCLLDYPYVKENYKVIAIDLSKITSIWCWSKNNKTN